MAKIAVIGGTGMTDFLEGSKRREITVRYPVNGDTVTNVFKFRIGRISDTEAIYFDRNKLVDGVRPTDYRTYMVGLKEQGVEHVLSTSAVRSIDPSLNRGSILIPTDYVDFTDSDVLVDIGKKNVDMTKPFSMRGKILAAVPKKDLEIFNYGLYVVWTKGPTFESAAEVRHIIRTFGNETEAVLLGRPVPAEARLSRSLDMDYGCIAVVTNHAAGVNGKIIQSGDKVFERATPRLKKLLTKTISSL